MKVMLIDDERLAREELRGLLQEHADVTVCGEAANVTEALKSVPQLRPDLIFLDIEMPGRTGFDLLAALPPPHPAVVFVTAYDAFALRAFAVNALDYLMKPVHPDRLAQALAKVRQAPLPPESTPAEETGAPFREDDHVYIRDGDRSWFVPVRTLIWLDAEGNHSRLHFEAGTALLYRTFSSMEARLPASLFLRANRSQIVNLTRLENVQPWFSNSLKAKLRGGPEIEFSRRQAQLFRERMSL